MGKPIRYSPEVRERAVRMVLDHGKEYDSQWATIRSIAEKIGCSAETPRNWEPQAEKRDLEERRKRLELPAIDRDMLAAVVDNFERVMAEGPNPQKKDLLRRMVKKVLIHDKRTIEIWYALPNQASVRTLGNMAPRMHQSTNRPSVAQPQVWFRIVHVASDGHHHALGAAVREQTIEIALGRGERSRKATWAR